MVTVAGVNLPHTPFTIRQHPTVKEVRCHSDNSCWNSGWHALLQHGGNGTSRIRGTATVYWKPGSEAEARARRWVRSRWKLGRGGDCARDPGLGRGGVCVWGLRSRARRSLRPRPKGSGEIESAPEAKRGRAFFFLFFAAFYPPNLGILFYGTQHLACGVQVWCLEAMADDKKKVK